MPSVAVTQLPPFAAAQRPGSVTSARAGTIDIAYWRGGRVGQGPPILFLHGLGWDGALWWPFVERYLDRFDVICPDTRGHGASSKPPGPYSISLFADDMLALLDALKLPRVAVVGLSQGGMTAQTLATKAPQRVAALAALATAGRVDPTAAANMDERIKAQRESGPAAAARIAAKSIFSDGFLARTPGYLEAFIEWRVGMDAGAQEAAMRAVAGYDVMAGLATLAIPVLVMTGAADRLIPPAAGRAIAAAAPGAQYVEIPESGHMIAVEQPAAVAAALDPFLEAYRRS
ncbi:MAG TPA: alpha/beta hydrolase [Alphaproteobacteria bacterium]|nr:alpha/beta hydrolase [Alphaproteobacteria bacterium]